MSKRRRRKQRSLPANATLDASRRDLERELNVLTSPAAMADPQVVALLETVRQAKTNREMLEAILRLQHFVRKDASLLSSPNLGEQLNRMRSQADGRDTAEREWSMNRTGFIEEQFSRADAKKLTGDQAERAKAQVGKMVQEARQVAQGKKISRQLQLDWELEHGSKREISVTGWWEHVKQGDASVPVLRPDVIRIMHRSFILPPGVHTVPERVAMEYDRIQRGRQENVERNMLLDASGEKQGLEAGALELAQRRIDSKYGVGRESALAIN